MIVIYECVHRPELEAQFFAGYHVAGAPEQVQKDLKRLALNAWARFAVLAKLSRDSVQLIQAETENRCWVFRFLHELSPALRCRAHFKRCMPITLKLCWV